MARPDLLRHRKFRRLIAALGLPPPYVLGHLEWLWQTCYETGDSYLGDSMDVELGAQWQGEPGKFTQAMLAAGGPGGVGFIELAQQGGYQIHDLLENAPSYVKDRFRKRQERRGAIQASPGHAQKMEGQVSAPPGQSQEYPGSVRDIPGQSATLPPLSGTTESPSPSLYPQEQFESAKEQEQPTAGGGLAPPTRLEETNGTEDPANSPFLVPRRGTRQEGLRPLGEIAKSITMGLSLDQQKQVIIGFISQFDDWLKSRNCPEGLTNKQVRSLAEAGLTFEGARAARSKYESASRQIPVQKPGALAYKLLEDELDPDAARELRAEVASRKREFQDRRIEGAPP